MCVTYLGNKTLTWRDQPSRNRRREVTLFVAFNIVGFGFSVVTLTTVGYGDVAHRLVGDEDECRPVVDRLPEEGGLDQILCDAQLP